MATPTPAKLLNLMESAKDDLSFVLNAVLRTTFDIEVPVEEIFKELTPPRQPIADLCLPCFTLVRRIAPKADDFKAKFNAPPNPKSISDALVIAVQEYINTINPSESRLHVNGKPYVTSITAVAGYLNFGFSLSYHGQVINAIAYGTLLDRVEDPEKERVMIEYSQPNTHKAFHVGHMRNAALGDCLVRLYEQCGHNVTAVNYFGDEGAHVAKCLWYLQSVYLPKAIEAHKAGKTYDPSDPESVYPMASIDDIDIIPEHQRAEWLGELYTNAVNLLDLSLYSTMPFPQVVAGKVLSKESHPDETAPANWNVVQLDFGHSDGPVSVVCGGIGYEVGDIVAYLPVGAKLTKKMGVIQPKDMKGVMSHGVMLAESEIGGSGDDDDADGPVKAPEKEPNSQNKGDKKQQQQKKGGSKKGSSANAAVTATQQIKLLPADSKIGENLAELYKLPQYKDVSVLDIHNKLKREAADVLLKLEGGDAELVALWHKTGQWSLDEFHRIYDWLGCRFDHDFTESEVSEPSRLMVNEMYEKGQLTKDNGAVVMDLTEYNLGKCTLLKSDGAGLYATKDLSLAIRKFDQFKIDKSIYIVDAAQSYHFAQVFKVLELCGWEQAKKCLHLPYGLVVLPSGRMSSRKGNVMLFSQLRAALEQTLHERYGQHQSLHPEAVRRIAVAAIRYGMLNHDTGRDIVFDLDKWCNNTGNTGPYLLYAYSRIISMLTIRPEGDEASVGRFDFATILRQLNIPFEHSTQTCPYTNVTKINFTKWMATDDGQKFLALVDYDQHLTHATELSMVNRFHKYWSTIISVTEKNNPSPLCNYVFDVAQNFSAWYEEIRLRDLSIDAIPTKIMFLVSIAQTIDRVVSLLGIQTIDRM